MSDDRPYTKREMDLKIDEIHRDVKEVKVMLTYTNGKVKKIVLALVLLGGILVGLGFNEVKPILTLLL